MNKSELIDKLEKRVLFFSNHTDEYTKGVVDAHRYSLLLINQMIDGDTEQPKTASAPSPKSYLHSCITKELNAIYVAKNSDYGDAFGETYKKLGIISAVTRITDKVNRLQSLSTGNEVKVLDEKIEDTVMDLANYAIMLLIEMRMDTVEDSLVEYTENGLRLKEVVEDSHSINAGGSSLNGMDIDLNEAMKAFARIGGQ